MPAATALHDVAPATLKAWLERDEAILVDVREADEYARAWVFCLPSTYEGFGIPYAEAMAAGLPVVATPNVGARFVTDEGRTGLLVEPERIGPAIADLLLDDARRAALADAGRRRARAFDLARVVDAYERVYRDGIARTRPHRRTGDARPIRPAEELR